ncbi:hypothetical protein TGAMA5MH_09573 [Trichoderma gamsii]|uniref:F-box domain-containing protein n=1 Tax=Trichoderma gamsii TaxID=398673 RepID=A0A2K0SYZ1_9HYPO|nr:hypothetical protein TGAMA5MH_09573 [Trichoderma gamsii]
MVLTRLPKELLDAISRCLTGKDIKNLRLASKLFSDIPLPLSRVFISANPIDIEVFRFIADHETYRHGVKEIIWDEARFGNPRSGCEGYELESREAPCEYRHACKENMHEILNRRAMYAIHFPFEKAIDEQVKAQMPVFESWLLYCEYADQQNEVLQNGSDIKAFEYGLERFPALERITLTPAAHGILFNPLYNTPMLRSLPYGFNYNIPRGWPGTYSYARCEPWETEAEKEQWRGFREVIRCLADNKAPSVKELVLDVHQLPTGLTCHFFDHACPEYDQLVAVLRRPGFRRFDLALTAGGQPSSDWESFRNGRMRRALAETSEDLEHFHLRTDQGDLPGVNRELDNNGISYHFTPLLDILPIERWPKLRHFGLSKFLVRQDDVMSLLKALPVTIRTVELSFLCFLNDGDSYKALLDEMRNSLDWHTRDAALRPKVKIGLDVSRFAVVHGRAIWLEREVDSFLYEGGPCLFPSEDRPDDAKPGDGGTIRDEFQPEIDGPWADCPIWDYKDEQGRLRARAEKGGNPDVQAALDALNALDYED